MSRLKKKSRDLTAGSGCSTAWMDRASSGLQLERGGATGKICAAAFYHSESDLGGSESGTEKRKKEKGEVSLGKDCLSWG